MSRPGRRQAFLRKTIRMLLATIAALCRLHLGHPSGRNHCISCKIIEKSRSQNRLSRWQCHACTLWWISCGLTAMAAPKPESLPQPVSNNAVAQFVGQGQSLVFSFLGIGVGKSWDAITTAAYSLNLDTGHWSVIPPVPGATGRIAASAISASDRVFLFGGYSIDAQGTETTVANVDIYDPRSHRWSRGADIPVPVDDSVIGVYRNRYVYLISGWSNNDTVHNVQIYDSLENQWQQATPIPGVAVFGHAGSLVDNTIVYVDGAYLNPHGHSPRYIASTESWMGIIQPSNPAMIIWKSLDPHPGFARYRIAAGASEADQRVYFSGGTGNPYNFNGIGYNGIPSEPSSVAFYFDLHNKAWHVITENVLRPSMDHRALVATSAELIVAGGMSEHQVVTSAVAVIPKSADRRNGAPTAPSFQPLPRKPP